MELNGGIKRKDQIKIRVYQYYSLVRSILLLYLDLVCPFHKLLLLPHQLPLNILLSGF